MEPTWKRTGCTQNGAWEEVIEAAVPEEQKRGANSLPAVWTLYLGCAAAGCAGSAGVASGCFWGARAGTAAPAGMGRGLITRGKIALSPTVARLAPRG